MPALPRQKPGFELHPVRRFGLPQAEVAKHEDYHHYNANNVEHAVHVASSFLPHDRITVKAAPITFDREGQRETTKMAGCALRGWPYRLTGCHPRFDLGRYDFSIRIVASPHQVQPRTRNNTNKIGIGMPKSQSNIHPIAPCSVLRVVICCSVWCIAILHCLWGYCVREHG